MSCSQVRTHQAQGRQACGRQNPVPSGHSLSRQAHLLLWPQAAAILALQWGKKALTPLCAAQGCLNYLLGLVLPRVSGL